MQMNEENLFAPVLDPDEKIVKVIKPHRGRAWFSSILTLAILGLMMIGLGVAIMFSGERKAIVAGCVCIGLWVLLVIFMIITTTLWCNKNVYALTNKRVLIRTGYIGVDYKSLDYGMVGALAVNVNCVDKMYRKNTGSITFGSMASPMMANNVSKFVFNYIGEPYELYKEIKSYIDQNRNVAK